MPCSPLIHNFNTSNATMNIAELLLAKNASNTCQCSGKIKGIISNWVSKNCRHSTPHTCHSYCISAPVSRDVTLYWGLKDAKYVQRKRNTLLHYGQNIHCTKQNKIGKILCKTSFRLHTILQRTQELFACFSCQQL